jgi:hypothetical protein
MWDTRLCGYSLDVLGATLRQHRADYPDDAKPVWKTIYAMLSGGSTAAGAAEKSDLQELLDFMRRQIAQTPAAIKHKPIDQWTDADCFERLVEANAGLRDLGGKALPDPGGHRARIAANERAWAVNRYARDLKERGELVPAWLTCS